MGILLAMGRTKEALATVKEHLSLEEIQLALGEFCVAATGGGVMVAGFAMGFNTNDFKFLPILTGGVIGKVAAEAGLTHWQAAREKIRRTEVA